MKARLYFELGHKLRQTAAINYGVRHSSQVAYNSSLAIFDLFHMLCVATMNSFSFVEENTWQVSQLILIARRPHGTIFTRKIKTFFITMKLKAKKLLEVVSVLSPFSLVPQPNPAPRVSRVTDVRRCRFDTLGKSTPAHRAVAPRWVSPIVRSPLWQVHPPCGSTSNCFRTVGESNSPTTIYLFIGAMNILHVLIEIICYSKGNLNLHCKWN